MIEVVLVLIGLLWILFASFQDLKMREVANWLNFSLIVFVLAIRFFYSLFESVDFVFFYQGLIGLGIFLVIGNLFYYGRLFGGGDAKLMIALGCVLPVNFIFVDNLKIFVLFLALFLIVGSIYGLVWSLALVLFNFKKFKKVFFRLLVKNKKSVFASMFFGFWFLIFGFFEPLFFFIAFMFLVMPYFYLYAKAIDDSCMIRKVLYSKLREGDLLYKSIKLGDKEIKSNWDGLSLSEIKKIKKFKKNVFIRVGIPFVPVFLISYTILFYFYFSGFLFRLFI